ncbi:oxaloacetate decarboxylase subunit alpha [Salmonella enterica subsp. enterica serovar Typhi]|nr:oxaloacetate decarboxylase subunit alpha [Salmonella enterica subsp. enterica serovar Typhi]
MTIAITDVVLRDAHQSLFATRLRLDDMLPIAAQLDDVGYGSLECWGGATFDACIRFLGEDPWLRLRELKKAMPKTPLQMLLRGQNLLGGLFAFISLWKKLSDNDADAFYIWFIPFILQVAYVLATDYSAHSWASP